MIKTINTEFMEWELKRITEIEPDNLQAQDAYKGLLQRQKARERSKKYYALLSSEERRKRAIKAVSERIKKSHKNE